MLSVCLCSNPMVRNKPLTPEAFIQINAGPPGWGAPCWEHPIWAPGAGQGTNHPWDLSEFPAAQERGFSLGYPAVSSKPVHHSQLKLIGNLALPYLRSTHSLRHAAPWCQLCPGASRSSAQPTGSTSTHAKHFLEADTRLYLLSLSNFLWYLLSGYSLPNSRTPPNPHIFQDMYKYILILTGYAGV